jgi:hypothetical protein
MAQFNRKNQNIILHSKPLIPKDLQGVLEKWQTIVAN